MDEQNIEQQPPTEHDGQPGDEQVTAVQFGENGNPVNVVNGKVGTVVQINGSFTGDLSL